MKKLALISGLPRSGSTLLCNLINSNSEFHATPTSGIIDSVRNIRSTFSHNINYKTQDRLELMGNMQNALKGFIEGYFYDKNIVFDKCRGWSNHLQLIDAIFGHSDTKIIWTYRNPVEIVNSIERQYQKTILLENSDESADAGAFITLDRRIGTYMNDNGLISYPVEILRDAIEMGYGNRIHFVSYYDLCTHTQQVMDGIHDFIGEDRFVYDTDNVKQTSFEFDGFYNYKFRHNIKEGEIKYSQTEMVLPQKYIDIINQRYFALNKFILEGDIETFLNIILNKEEIDNSTSETPVENYSEEKKEDNNNPFLIK